MNLFSIASNDASVEYLSKIFGNMNGIISISGQSAASPISLLGTMFKTFNTVVLAVGALLLVYITVVGIMNTAHEGQFMGKNWNNLWIPIRTVMGIALLVPTSSGYSSLQIIMMWVIMQGIGAADTLWTTVLGYVNVVGSVYTQTKIALPEGGSNEVLGGLFKGVSCEVTAKQAYPNPTTGGNISSAGSYYCAMNSKDPFCAKPLTNIDTGSTYINFGPDGACGQLKYCNLTEDCKGNAEGIACLACQGQISALTAIIETYQNIAKGFVQSDYSYRQFYSQGGGKSDKPNPNWQWIYDYCAANKIPQSACVGGSNLPSPLDKGDTASASPAAVKTVYWPYAPTLAPTLGNVSFSDTAIKYYVGLLETAYSTYLATHAQGEKALSNNQVFQRARNTGWIFAGGYYYAIANKRSSDMNFVLPTLEWQAPDLNQGRLKDIRNNYASANYLIQVSKGDTNPAGANQASDQFSSSYKSATSSLTGTIEKMTRSENPLLGMQIAGKVMLLIAQVLFIVMWHVISEVGIVGYFSAEILGNGFINPIGPVMTTLTIFILPAIYALLGLLVTLGATLSIYIPLIPYVVFTFGAIGWLISVIEAMVAGPLVALGIISPSGNHELLGKAEPALMLLFNVFLRPSLMIFGLMASMLLASVVLQMINAAFWTIVFNGIFDIADTGAKDNTYYASGASVGAGASALDILSLLLFLCAYVTTVFTAMNKCFSAIYIIPQQVMAWISGQGSQYDEATALGEIKGGVSGAGGKASGGMVGTGKAATSGVKDISEQAGKKSAEEKQGGPTITGGD